MNTKTSKKIRKNGTSTLVDGVNIFKNLGRSDADEAFAKIELAFKIHTLITQMGLSQTEAAKLLHADRARVSNLVRGRLTEFSIDRLFHFLNRLGQDVDMTVRPKRHAKGQVHIFAKAG